ncbi:MAG: hypothetical protein JG718_00350 [Candidatus Thiothrix moscowensis]|nr:hypothetical protein [Candidatus Thiothrix moscowensis]
MKYLTRTGWFVLGWLLASTPANAAQVITPADASVTVNGGTVAFTPVYSVTSPQTNTLTGLGLRIHFDADALQWQGVSGTYAYGLQPVGVVTADTENFDADPNTDSYVVVAWVDLAARWPGTGETPLNLLTATFQPKTGFVGTTQIRTSASATADSASFQSTPMSVSVVVEPSVQVRALLQGAFVAAEGKMQDNLRAGSLLPLGQPFAAQGYAGTETTTTDLLATTGNDAPVDWILLELHDSSKPQTVVARKAALLQRDGDVVTADTGSATLHFSGVASGSYYLALRHRNHLGVMSALPLTFAGTPLLVDFTSASTGIYGVPDIRLHSGTYRLLPSGDANNDGKLIADGPDTDKNAILGSVLTSPANTDAQTNFQLSGYLSTDLNLDGKTVFAGPNNEINILLGNVLLAPGNSTTSTNYILRGSLP